MPSVSDMQLCKAVGSRLAGNPATSGQGFSRAQGKSITHLSLSFLTSKMVLFGGFFILSFNMYFSFNIGPRHRSGYGDMAMIKLGKKKKRFPTSGLHSLTSPNSGKSALVMVIISVKSSPKQSSKNAADEWCLLELCKARGP